MKENLVAKASIQINASTARVWIALVTPDEIKQYMFGTNVVTDWREGSAIIWKGEWQGKPYEDKGQILQLIPQQTIQYSHFSPMTGLPDIPENYHKVKIDLNNQGSQTKVNLAQDNCTNEEDRVYSEKNWEMMLVSLKHFVEN